MSDKLTTRSYEELLEAAQLAEDGRLDYVWSEFEPIIARALRLLALVLYSECSSEERLLMNMLLAGADALAEINPTTRAGRDG